AVATSSRALRLRHDPPGLLSPVTRDYVERGHELEDGDEVAWIPPVSGGSFRLVERPLDVAAVLREVEDPEAGAVASFVGTVRRRSRERDVLHLEYEAFEEMAEPMLVQLGEELTERHRLCAVALHHRPRRGRVRGASVVP